MRTTRVTRRSLWLRAGAAAPALEWLAAACAPGKGLPLPPLRGRKVIRAAAFIGQEGSFGGERGAVELQRAANAVNEQRLGFEVKVDFMLLPPFPTPAPFRQPAGPAEGATPVPTPTPFTPTAITLEQALTGGELAAGAPPPDLALVTQAFDLPILLERKLVEPLEEILKVDRSLKLDDFAPGALDTVRYRGKIAALPLAGSVNFLLYDSSLFEVAGVAKPGPEWTWTNFVEAGRRLTRGPAEGEQWGTVAHTAVPLLLSLIWSEGGELLSKDGRRSLLGDPQARAGMQLWADLILKHRLAPNPPAGQNLQFNWSQSEMWVFSPQPGQPTFIGGSQSAGSNARVAMAISSNLPSVFGGPPGQARRLMAADVPKGRQRATQFGLSAALVLGSKAQDPRLALRAAAALSEHLLQRPIGSFGYPVRKPDPTLLRRLQSRLSEEDAEVVSHALTYSRGVPPELARRIYPALNGKFMTPVLRDQATVDEAARETAAALDEQLRG